MSTRSNARNVYPSPTLPDGQVVLGKSVTVKFDMSNAPYGFPYELEVVLVNQDSIGPFSEKALFIPYHANEIKVPPFRRFKVGDQVQAYARLYYQSSDPADPYPFIQETPRSEPYQVVA